MARLYRHLDFFNLITDFYKIKMQTQIISGFQLSPQQKRLWQLQQNSSEFYCQCTVAISGDLQPETLRNAFENVIRDHDILRTSLFCLPGVKTPVMVIEENVSFCWEVLEFTDIFELLKRARKTHQDSAKTSPLLCYLIKVSQNQRLLIISLPALYGDVQTLKILIKKVSEVYNKIDRIRDSELTQYVQFSEWQNQLIIDEDSENAQNYWQQQKATALKLPDEQNSINQPFVTDFYSFNINSECVNKITNFAQQYQTTVESILFACWQTLIWRLTGESEIGIGKKSDRRDYEELQEVLGLLATWLPIKTKFNPNLSFIDIIQSLTKTLEEATEWQDYFVPESDQLLAFPIGFEFEDLSDIYPSGDVSFSLDQVYSCIEPFKVKLNCIQNQQSLTAEFYWDIHCFTPETIQRLADQFQTLLNEAITTPQTVISKLNILSEGDRKQLLIDFNQTQIHYPKIQQGIHQLFAEQAAKTPDQIALVYENEQLTYTQLNAKANQLAHYLQTLGVKPETVVGLCLERSLDLIVGLLGILKAGGAYLPLDPLLPLDQIQLRLQDADAKILLTDANLIEALSPDVTSICLSTQWHTISQYSEYNPTSEVTPENLVYVLYTSGSTGQPKGVAVEHRQLLNYLYGILDKLQPTPGESFATLSTIAADLGNTAIFPALCGGGCLHLISHERATNPEALVDYCDRYPIDYLKIVPSHLNALLMASQPEKLLPRKTLILGGDVLSWELVEKIQQYAPHCQILNHYGPTEATVGVLTYSLPQQPITPTSETVPLGRPLGNIQIYILDNHLQPVPIGVSGELYIGGNSVARGYLNNPELTTEKFISRILTDDTDGTDWLNGGACEFWLSRILTDDGDNTDIVGACVLPRPTPLYKTGDLARYLPDGNIEFLGRIDQQVKIRGFRIELGEIEIVLKQHPAIREIVVIARKDEAGNKRLIAYFIPQQSQWAVSELRNFLKQKLPEYMIPSAFVPLKKLPLTANGKIDRQALPDPDQTRPDVTAEFQQPRTPVEATLAEIWRQVLHLEQIGIHDNFFELGGDSIMTIQIAARANQAGLNITPKQLFENPTIAGLAAIVTPLGGETLSLPRIDFEQAETALWQQLPVGLDPQNIAEVYELTPIQKGILFHSLYAPEVGLYVFQTRFTLQGALNIDAFQQAWQQILERHTILRTSFHWQDREQPLQVVHKQVNLPLEQQDWRHLDTLEQQRQLQLFLKCDRTLAFDLSQVPLMRLTLLRLADDSYEFVWSRHFIVADGWSIPLILGEVVQIYETLCQGQPVTLPASIPFHSYIEWFRQQPLSEATSYWQHLLQGFKTPTPLTSLYVEGLANPEEKYDDQQITLSSGTTSALQAFSRQHQLTLNTIFQGVWAFLLSHYSNQTEIVYGCTVSGRPVTLAGAESIAGMLVNTLPVRVQVDPQQPLLDWLKQLQVQLLEMRQYEYTSLVEIQAKSEVPRGVSLFDSIVVFENLPTPEALRNGTQTITVLESNNYYKINYPITVVIIPESPLIVGINYDFNRIDSATIDGILTHFKLLLENWVKHPQACLKDFNLETQEEQKMSLIWEQEAIFNF